jgi:glycosyltransferase involved in cell wall biosynthesis
LNNETKSAQLSVIIPVYNEVKTVHEIVRRVQAIPEVGEIVIVDDCSTDGTREILAKDISAGNNVRILYHEKNKGKGAAIRTGLREVTQPVVVIQDADLEYEPSDLASLFQPIAEGRAQVVYGSRNLRKQNSYSYFSFYLGGRVLTWITNLLYGIHITDEPTCYKAFRTDLIRTLNLQCTGFEFCPEVTAKVSRRKIPILEVPIHYNPRHLSEGKKIRWQDGVSAIWTLIRYRFWNE